MDYMLRLGAGIVLAFSSLVHAQSDFPNRSVRIVIGQTPGGPTDIPARMLAQRLSERIGQPFVVENRPGAASNIGTEIVARAPKDGYTLLMAAPQHVTNLHLFPNLPFDPVRDFMPVSLVSKAALVLVVNPEVPARTLKELLEYLRTRPGQINWSSAGNGGSGHLALELLRSATGVNVVHVPFKGAQPALADLVAGRVQAGFDSIATSEPHAKAGRLRPIAVTSTSRSALLPEVPTVSEAGLPGYEAVGFAALLAPAGSPPEAINKLAREVAASLQQTDLRERLQKIGMEPVGSRPDELADYLRAESAKWGKVIREANIRVE